MTKPTRILVLPGFGDIYWVAVTLEDFCRQKGLGKPEVHIWNFDGRPRAAEFVERIPFASFGGYFDHSTANLPEFRESYTQNGRCVYPNFLGFDYYLSVNGALRNGRTISEAMPGLKTDWHFRFNQTPAELDHAEEWRGKFPEGYIVAHFSDHGMFKYWTSVWDDVQCAAFLRYVTELTGLPVLLTGSAWDAPFANKVYSHTTNCHNYVGKTNVDEFLSLFRGAKGCVGWCGGNTILATAFKVPTMMFWHRYFPDPRFYKNACPPEALGKWYLPVAIDTPKKQPLDTARDFRDLLGRG